jgi:hypothetical protein
MPLSKTTRRPAEDPQSPRLLAHDDRQRCAGFILPLGKVGLEDFDHDEQTKDLFGTQREAIAALSTSGQS